LLRPWVFSQHQARCTPKAVRAAVADYPVAVVAEAVVAEEVVAVVVAVVVVAAAQLAVAQGTAMPTPCSRGP
jgi:hypothetical protein